MHLFPTPALSSGMTFRHLIDGIIYGTFSAWQMEWAYPVFKPWFALNSTAQGIGYCILFALALVLLLKIRRRKNILLWCLLYAAEAFNLLLTVTTNYYFAHFILGVGTPGVSAAYAFFAAFMK